MKRTILALLVAVSLAFNGAPARAASTNPFSGTASVGQPLIVNMNTTTPPTETNQVKAEFTSYSGDCTFQLSGDGFSTPPAHAYAGATIGGIEFGGGPWGAYVGTYTLTVTTTSTCTVSGNMTAP